jgi:delta 1-pyrroline-5-carboxylate dehydrogenase
MQVARETGLGDHAIGGYNGFMSIEDLPLDAAGVYSTNGLTGVLVGVQPFDGFGMSGPDSKPGGPESLSLHMLARTVVERF